MDRFISSLVLGPSVESEIDYFSANLVKRRLGFQRETPHPLPATYDTSSRICTITIYRIVLKSKRKGPKLCKLSSSSIPLRCQQARRSNSSRRGTKQPSICATHPAFSRP